MAYHPPQRAVAAFVFTLDRWMLATFHLPKLHAFEEYLARGRAFFALTNVSLGQGPGMEFLALRATAAHLVVPEASEQELYLASPAGNRPRDVSCYLQHVAVHGTLELLPGIRTSDFLAHQNGFITLRACRVVPPLPGRPEPHPVVFVNAGAILALAEEGGRVGEEPDASPKTHEPAT